MKTKVAMTEIGGTAFAFEHDHVFLGEGHERSERRAWAVIALCGAMMVIEIVGGLLFGSIALVADGLHMSTHAGALLLAALAYMFARRYAHDRRFTFGTGKLGDLAGFTSAIVLALIALLIAYEAIGRFLHPVAIRFTEALPIAALGLAVNIASVWLLGGGHPHGHSHSHGNDDHGHDHDHPADAKRVGMPGGPLALEIFETGHPPVFRLRSLGGTLPPAGEAALELTRPDGTRESYAFEARDGYLEGTRAIPEPHAFSVALMLGDTHGQAVFEEHAHEDHAGAAHRDNNMRAAVVHVLADAAVSALVIAGLGLAWIFGWSWTDPAAGIIGASVITAWSWSLVRQTGAILLDMNPDRGLTERVRAVIEEDGDHLDDLHVWRLGPGHLSAIVAVRTPRRRDAAFYRAKLARFQALSHVTVEVHSAPA